MHGIVSLRHADSPQAVVGIHSKRIEPGHFEKANRSIFVSRTYVPRFCTTGEGAITLWIELLPIVTDQRLPRRFRNPRICEVRMACWKSS